MTSRVHSQSNTGFAHGDEVGVAIDSALGHLGIFHSAGRKQVCQTHLAWHNRLLSEPIDCIFQVWVALPIPRERARIVAAYCRLFVEENARGEVPYGFSPPTGALSVTGHLEPGVVGLTCASLVLAIFERADQPLLEYATWEVRPADEEWQRKIVGYLGGDIQQMTAVEQQIPATRYRPVEVATAAASDNPPLDYRSTLQSIDLFREAVERANRGATAEDL